MRRITVLPIAFGAALAAASFSSVRAQQPANRTVLDGVYAAEQAKRGETLFAENCAACHDPKLVGGIGPALAGKEFIAAWKDKTVGELFEMITNTMPLTAPGTLTPAQSADAVSFILSANQFPAGTMELAADAAPLKAVKFAEPGAASAGAAGAASVEPAGAAPPAATAAAPADAAGAASADAAGGAGSDLNGEGQAKRGQTVFTGQCVPCHGPRLRGGVGPALTGSKFIAKWKDKSVGDLFEQVQANMPFTAPGTLTPQQVADVVAFVLSVSQYPAGATELTTDLAALKAVPLGEPAKK